MERVGERLKANPLITNVVVSEPFVTPAIGGPDSQADYLNACFRFDCAVQAPRLLEILNDIENDLGRERRVRWASRTVDLDLLLYDQQIIEGQGTDLCVPHPRMSFRRFVLEPAVGIAGDMLHPKSGLNLKQLLVHLDGAEKRIGFASTTEEKCLQLATQLRKLCIQKGFRFNHFIRPLVPNQTIHRMKLVVFWERDEQMLRKAASCFPGPTLKLEGEVCQTMTDEMSSTIEAMEAF